MLTLAPVLLRLPSSEYIDNWRWNGTASLSLGWHAVFWLLNAELRLHFNVSCQVIAFYIFICLIALWSILFSMNQTRICLFVCFWVEHPSKCSSSLFACRQSCVQLAVSIAQQRTLTATQSVDVIVWLQFHLALHIFFYVAPVSSAAQKEKKNLNLNVLDLSQNNALSPCPNMMCPFSHGLVIRILLLLFSAVPVVSHFAHLHLHLQLACGIVGKRLIKW